MVRSLRPGTDAGPVVEPEPTFLRLLLRDLQPLPPPDPLDALHIHRPTGFPKQSGDAPIAVAPIPGRERDDVRGQRVFVGTSERHFPLGRALLAEDTASRVQHAACGRYCCGVLGSGHAHPAVPAAHRIRPRRGTEHRGTVRGRGHSWPAAVARLRRFRLPMGTASGELRPSGPRQAQAPTADMSAAERLRRLGPVLMLVLLVLGGIYSGWLTSTKAAGVGLAASVAIALSRCTISLKGLARCDRAADPGPRSGYAAALAHVQPDQVQPPRAAPANGASANANPIELSQ